MDKLGPQIAVAGRAAAKHATVDIVPMSVALDGSGRKARGERFLRLEAAAPLGAVSSGAGLVELGSIEPHQAEADGTEAQRIAVDRDGAAGQRRTGLIGPGQSDAERNEGEEPHKDYSGGSPKLSPLSPNRRGHFTAS